MNVPSRRRRLHLEALEHRLLLSTGFSAVAPAPITEPAAHTSSALLPGAKLQTEDQKLTPVGVTVDYYQFGNSVKISDGTLAVSARGAGANERRTGAVHVYGFDGTRWVWQQKLTASDAEQGDNFGSGLVISGDKMLLSSHHRWGMGQDTGAVYFFQYDGTSWQQRQKFKADDTAAGDAFGYGRKISGDTAIMGASGHDAHGLLDSGAAYVFQFNGSQWVQQQKLTASDAAAGDRFGGVAFDGDTIVVSAPLDDDNGRDSGSAYFFRFDGRQWVEVQKLSPSDASERDQFSLGVIQGDTAIGRGGDAIYVFGFDDAQDQWVQRQRLTPFDAEGRYGFGSYALSGDTLVLGASRDDHAGPYSGSAYVYTFDGTEWVVQQKLIASDAAEGDRFGSVAVNQDTVFVGAYYKNGPRIASGAAYIYRLRDPVEVLARHVFYNNSSFDGNDPAPNAQDDNAIAPDKTALLPGETATFENYTSYAPGINGIIIDVANLAATPTGKDFQFRVGNDDAPDLWQDAPQPGSITLRPGAGLRGSDRITIVWPDGAIARQWLQVTLLPTLNTGLLRPDVFYFGNAIGESGNSTTEAKVSAIDMLAARDNQRHFLDPAPVDFNFDFDRNARVNAVDMLIARNNTTHFLNALKLISVPGEKSGESRVESRELRAESLVSRVESRELRVESLELRAVESELLTLDPRLSSGSLAWLYQWEPTTVQDRHPEKDGSAAAWMVHDGARGFPASSSSRTTY